MAASYTFEDLSGSSTPVTGDNPYQDLVAACHDNPTKIQTRYNDHRVNRNAQQRAKLLSPDFQGVVVDEILAKLEDPTIEPGFKDWRHCLVFWARPTEAVRSLISEIQQKLLKVAPSLWTMPLLNLHMTALEITHSLTMEEIDTLVDKMIPQVSDICNYTQNHRARLVKPLLSFDAQALALSFLPATGEEGRSLDEDGYTYHHLRRDLFTQAQATGVKVGSRYVVPSAHLTIARFVTKRDFETPEGQVDYGRLEKLVEAIDEINKWLHEQYWPNDNGIKSGGEWVVGSEKGLEFRKGALWYGGGGETVYLGKGF